MIEIEFHDEALKRVFAEGGRMADQITRACQKRLHPHWSSIIAHRADDLVPEQFSTLKNTRQIERIPGGFRISYGGMAAPYAWDQHENTSYHHNPPRYKWSYEGRTTDAPGAWNPPRGSGITATTIGSVKSHRLRTIWTRGGQQVSRRGGGWWRYEHVIYTRRSLRTDHPIKPTATHHWLYGRAFSAYESNVDRLIADLQDYSAKVWQELIDRAA